VLSHYLNRRRLGAYLDGALDEGTARSTAAHLATCGVCQREADALRRLRALLQQGSTVADPDWKPLFDPSTPTNGTPLVTPPFPDHPSGHSCNSSAILHTLHNFFGTDKMAFDVQSPRFPGYARHFTRFSEALREIIGARVWGGIHFRTADEQGAVLGLKVAHYLKKHDLQPVR